MTGEIPTPETDALIQEMVRRDFDVPSKLHGHTFHARKQERELSQLRDSFNRQRKNYTDLYAAIVGSDDGASVGDIDPFEVANQLRARAEKAEGECAESRSARLKLGSRIDQLRAENAELVAKLQRLREILEPLTERWATTEAWHPQWNNGEPFREGKIFVTTGIAHDCFEVLKPFARVENAELRAKLPKD